MRRIPGRVLIAVPLAAAMLGACNGPGLSSSGLPPGPFYLSGKANTTGSSGQIQFFAGSAVDAYDLVVVDPAGTTVNRVAAAGTWAPMASVSQWTTASGSGSASNWGPRYLVFAQLAANAASGDAPLMLLDLARTSSTGLPAAGRRISTASTVSSALCTSGQGSGLVLNDYVAPSNSWVTLRVAGPDNSCSTVDNHTIAIALTASAGTAPVALGLAEPVEAIHDANGGLTGAIELVHILPTQIGITAPTLQQADTKLNVVTTIGTSAPIQGTGNTTSGAADFQSLGITATSQVWLYRDVTALRAIRLAAPAPTTLLYTLRTTVGGSGDVLQAGRALFDGDGSTAYLAVNNASGSSYILRVSTATAVPSATVVVSETTATSIQLVGLTASTGYLVYVAGGSQPTIKAIPKSSGNSTIPLTVVSLSASQQLDTVPPAVVADTLYYNLDDNSGGTSPFRQVYSVAFSGSGPAAPVAFSAPGGACSVLIRPIYPPLVSTTAPAYGAVVLASSASFCQAADATLAYAGASLIGVDASGKQTSEGQLPRLAAQMSNPPANSATALQWVDFGYFFAEPGIAAAIDGPVQSGLPALLELVGANAQSVPTVDVESFLPGSTLAPVRITQNLQ